MATIWEFTVGSQGLSHQVYSNQCLKVIYKGSWVLFIVDKLMFVRLLCRPFKKVSG